MASFCYLALGVCTVFAMATDNKPRAFNPPSVPEPPPTYSQVCVTPILPSSVLITLAGQTGLQKNGTVPTGIKEQARAAYETIHKCLEAAGATPRDIVRTHLISCNVTMKVLRERLADCASALDTRPPLHCQGDG